MRASDQRSRNRARLSRKDLKAPDEFISVTGRVLTVAGQHLRTIVLGLGGITAVIIIVWSLLAYVHGIEREASASLWQIETELRNTADAEAVPSGLAERLQEITHRFGAGEARNYAWLYLGHLRFRQGDYAAALAAYEQAQAGASPTDLRWPLAALGAAKALEARGDLKAAQDAYQRVIDAKPLGFVLEAYLGKGRMAQQNHDLATAIAAYSAVIEHFPARAAGLGLAEKVEGLKTQP